MCYVLCLYLYVYKNLHWTTKREDRKWRKRKRMRHWMFYMDWIVRRFYFNYIHMCAVCARPRIWLGYSDCVCPRCHRRFWHKTFPSPQTCFSQGDSYHFWFDMPWQYGLVVILVTSLQPFFSCMSVAKNWIWKWKMVRQSIWNAHRIFARPIHRPLHFPSHCLYCGWAEWLFVYIYISTNIFIFVW